MTDWPQSVSLPGFGEARSRRRTSITEPVEFTVAGDTATMLLAYALMAARSTQRDTVTIGVLDDGRWRRVTIEFSPGSMTAALRNQVLDGLEDTSQVSAPPPGSAVAVFGDQYLDSGYVALRITSGQADLEGPYEPIGGIDVLAQRLGWLIDQVAPDVLVDGIASISADERDGARSRRIGPRLGPVRHVLARIERSARLAPHAAAITTPWTTLSYDELMVVVADRHAMLRREGVRAGDVVGLNLTRSADLVATMLALWEARAAFVPFTADLPRRRIVQMLEDAGARRVVTDLGGWRAPGRPIDRLEVDRLIHERRTTPRERPTRSLDVNAYVVFTSSATGRPKGIPVDHRHLAHYLHSVTPVMPRADRLGVMLATTPIGDDACMLELVWPLTQGWEVVIDPRRDIAIGPVARRRRATHLNTTPTAASLMRRTRDGREVLETVQHVLLGGEAVRAELVADLRQITRAEVTVRHGPAECTVDIAWGRADHGSTQGVLPIGRPLPGHRVDIVDDEDRTVGSFSVGELVVSGDAVGKGHLGRDERRSPFEPRDGEPTFRTGDIAWSDPEGAIHLTGRRDGCVNVRGHRVEVAEVDARLRAHPDVTDAATLARGEAERRRLESFVVESRPMSDEDLRLWMQDTLPEPMVPSVFHRLAALPRSGSASIDRVALELLAHEQAGLMAPRRALTSTEARVASIFEDALEVARVPPDQSVFELGATSSTALLVASELEKIIGRRVSLSRLIDQGSVEAIAAAIEHGRLGGDVHTLVPIVERGNGLPMYCVPGPDGHAGTLRPLGEALGRPFLGLEFTGTDGATAPDPTVEAMADRFVLAVRKHRGNRPIVLGGYAGGGFVALEMARRLEAAGTRVMLLVLIDSMNPKLELRSLGQKVVDGFRDLRAPDDLSPVRVLRNRLAADRLSRQDSLFAAMRRGRTPTAVDLTPDFHRAARTWEPPSYDGSVLVVRSAAVVPVRRGWERAVTGRLETVAVESGHVRMMLPPDVEELASEIRGAIERVEAAHRR